jgi:DNA-binding NtrC family response regulator
MDQHRTFKNTTRSQDANDDTTVIGHLPRRQSPSTTVAGTAVILGHSKAMAQIRDVIARFGPTRHSVLILGETGVGKELAARAIHACSLRCNGPFVAVNAATLTGALAGSELFGHVRGSFTGATRSQQGLFASAERGTLFLDEVGELPLDVQASLLRVLETHEVRPVGSERSRLIDVRIVTATHRDLSAMVREGRFRGDLLYRLDVLRVRLPPLRERSEDIALLAEAFLAHEGVPSIRPLGHRVVELLQAQSWLGNVRELANVVTRAVVFAAGEPPSVRHFVAAIHHSTPPTSARSRSGNYNHAIVQKALIAHGGSVRATARALGISRTTLRSWIEQLGVTRPTADRTHAAHERGSSAARAERD